MSKFAMAESDIIVDASLGGQKFAYVGKYVGQLSAILKERYEAIKKLDSEQGAKGPLGMINN